MEAVSYLNPLGAPLDTTEIQNVIGSIMAGEHQQQSSTYFSTVMLASALTGAGPYTYTIAAGTALRAFSYGLGQDLSVVGYPAGSPASFADTNLATANVSNNGDWVIIFGIGIQPTPTSEPLLVKALDEVTSVIPFIGGDKLFPLGNPSMVPGGGGLYGMGDSAIGVPDQTSYVYKTGNLTNGDPLLFNLRILPTLIVWAPAGRVDSTFAVQIRTERAAAYTNLSADRVAVGGGASTPGTAAFTHPAATAVFVRYKVFLATQQVNQRSANQ